MCKNVNIHKSATSQFIHISNMNKGKEERYILWILLYHGYSKVIDTTTYTLLHSISEAQTHIRGNLWVKLSLTLIYQARHGDVWGSGSIAPPFLISTLDGDEWSASRPDALPPRKEPQYS
jgi:hypothetical protein